jgi:hypothetical protein
MSRWQNVLWVLAAGLLLSLWLKSGALPVSADANAAAAAADLLSASQKPECQRLCPEGTLDTVYDAHRDNAHELARDRLVRMLQANQCGPCSVRWHDAHLERGMPLADSALLGSEITDDFRPKQP